MIKQKAEIMDGQGVKRAIKRIAHEIIERNKGAKDLAIVGIQRRGLYIANRIAQCIKNEDDVDVLVGALDIHFYNEDLSVVADNPIVKRTSINFSVNNKIVIIVDDVLYTGRTARAAIESIMNFGRPQSIQLAELIDRGNRELPIRADYIGKFVPTSKEEVVNVKVIEVDGSEGVTITEIRKSILM